MGVFGIGTVIGSLLNYNTQQLNRQQTEYWNRKNFIAQMQENDWQHRFATKQFEEQKYLNRNGIQLQAADMQKAGMNPAMAMGVGSLSSGSYSSNSQAPQGNPYLVEDNALSHILDGFKVEEELKMREKEINAQKDIARINASSAKYTADKSAESAKYSADTVSASSKYSSDRSYDASKYTTDEQVKEIKRHNEQTEKASRAQIQQRQMEIWDNYTLAEKQVEQVWEQLRLAKTKQDREHYLNVYNSAIKTLQTISSEAREWYDSATFQHMFNKKTYNFISEKDLPF